MIAIADKLISAIPVPVNIASISFPHAQNRWISQTVLTGHRSSTSPQRGSLCPFRALRGLPSYRLICSCSSRSSCTTSSNRCFSASSTWFRRSSSWTKKKTEMYSAGTQVGKSSLLTMTGTFNLSYVEPWGVQFHHTFVQGQLEGTEGWLRISRHPEVAAPLPGTWNSLACSLHRSALLHIYRRSKAPWESWTQHACTISRHPCVQMQKARTGM